MKLSCDVILDLIPLVKDGVASEDSTLIVNEHIKSCDSCRSEFEIFQIDKMEEPSIKDEKIIFAIKRSIFTAQISILLVGTIVGIAITNSMGMFYNFLIMPIVGGISKITFKKKWYLAPVGIFFVTYLWQVIQAAIVEGFYFGIYYAYLYSSAIYSILVTIGILITALLQFAFRREK